MHGVTLVFTLIKNANIISTDSEKIVARPGSI